jgi:hypothetical protein
MTDTPNSENLVFNPSGDPNHPRCSQTNRLYELGHGALDFAAQTKIFLSQLSPEEKAQRLAAANKLNAANPAGSA